MQSKQPDGVLLDQYPDRVYAQGGSEGDIQQIDGGEDQHQNAGPFFAFEQSDAADDSRNG